MGGVPGDPVLAHSGGWVVTPGALLSRHLVFVACWSQGTRAASYRVRRGAGVGSAGLSGRLTACPGRCLLLSCPRFSWASLAAGGFCPSLLAPWPCSRKLLAVWGIRAVDQLLWNWVHALPGLWGQALGRGWAACVPGSVGAELAGGGALFLNRES